MLSRPTKLRQVGVLWKPKPGAKSQGTGSLTINGLRQRFVVMPNKFKRHNAQPDFVLLSSEPPEADDYAQGRKSGRSKAQTGEAIDSDVSKADPAPVDSVTGEYS